MFAEFVAEAATNSDGTIRQARVLSSEPKGLFDRSALVIAKASRMTPSGLLQWQITVRDDGQRLFDGCLPTLIQWGDVHPTGSMPQSSVALQALHVAHPAADELQAALNSVDIVDIFDNVNNVNNVNTVVRNAPARITAIFQTPKGTVKLVS